MSRREPTWAEEQELDRLIDRYEANAEARGFDAASDRRGTRGERALEARIYGEGS